MLKSETPTILGKEKIWTIILICSLGVMITGLMSDLYLGDEIYHYRFAKAIYKSGERVTFDPLFGKNFTHQTYYLVPPLWHILLASLWKIAGGISFPLAQIYQTFYYTLLLFLTYKLGKEIYGGNEGTYSLILISTVPMIVSFDILFYVDIPLSTLTILTFLLISKGRYTLAGFGFGLMYLTKFNGPFFGIPFLLIISLLNDKKRLLTKILCFSLPCLLIIIPDIYWRGTHSYQEAQLGSIQNIFKMLGTGITQNAPNSTFISVTDNIKYFGLGLIWLLIVYLIKRRFQKKDLLLWIPIFFYFSFFVYFFKINGDIRYLLPITPFLCVIASKGISSCKDRKLIIIFLAVCFIQFFCVLIFVHNERRISSEIKEGINFIKANVPEDGIILYPEYNLTEYTNRRVAWTTMFWDLEKVLWGDDEFIRNSLKKHKVHYILIKKTRIYDDGVERHLMGYPTSFVNRLPAFHFLELRFNNRELSLWKLREEEVLH